MSTNGNGNGQAHALVHLKGDEACEVREGFSTVIRFMRELEVNDEEEAGLVILHGADGNRVAFRPEDIVYVRELVRHTRQRRSQKRDDGPGAVQKRSGSTSQKRSGVASSQTRTRARAKK